MKASYFKLAIGQPILLKIGNLAYSEGYISANIIYTPYSLSQITDDNSIYYYIQTRKIYSKRMQIDACKTYLKHVLCDQHEPKYLNHKSNSKHLKLFLHQTILITKQQEIHPVQLIQLI